MSEMKGTRADENCLRPRPDTDVKGGTDSLSASPFHRSCIFPNWECGLRSVDGSTDVSVRLDVRWVEPDRLYAPHHRVDLTIERCGGADLDAQTVEVYWLNTGLLACVHWCYRFLHEWDGTLLFMQLGKLFARPQVMWRVTLEEGSDVRMEFFRSFDGPKFEPWFQIRVDRAEFTEFVQSLWYDAYLLDLYLFSRYRRRPDVKNRRGL